MKIPETTYPALQEAMNRFDKELRSTPRWARRQEDELSRNPHPVQRRLDFKGAV
jgi:hypothetical protein